MLLRLPRYVAQIALLTLVYFAAGRLGLLLAVTQENTTLVWPPTGIALAAVVLLGYRVWPGIALGAFLVNATTSAPLPAVLAISTGNVLEALAGAMLLRRAVGFSNSLERIRDVLGLAALAALVSTAISATVGVSALHLVGRVPAGGFGIVWLYWWLGDVMGALVVAPLLLVWGDWRSVAWERGRAIEALGLSAALVLVCQLTYGGWLDQGTARPPLTYLVAPLLVWAALRFGPRGAVTASFATIAFAIFGTIQGHGPFVLGTVEESLAHLHTYLAVTSVTVLLLAAIQSEWTRTRSELRQAEAKSRALIEHSFDAIALVDRDGTLLYSSPSAMRITGRAMDELIGQNGFARVHPEHQQAARSLFAESLSKPGITLQSQFRYLHKSGSWIWLEVTGTNLLHEPAVQAIVLNYQDISEQRKSEQSLRDSAVSLDAAQERAQTGSWEIGVNAERGRWSKGLFRLLNRDPALGEPTRIESLEYVHPEDRAVVTDAHKRVLDQVGPQSVDFRTNPLHGPVRYFNTKVEGVRDERGTLVKIVGNVLDITERKRSEAELQASGRRLAAMSRQLITAVEAERRHLARELHDEIGQVLTAVKINLQGLKNACEPAAGQRLDESIGIVGEAIQQVRSLSLDLRPPMLDDFGLAPALRWFVDRHQNTCGCDLNLVTRCPGTRLSAELESAVYRLVQEAITNVVRHSRARHAVIEVGQGDRELSVAIGDDGVGFDVAAARDRAAHGSSVGLLGMQERVELLGGRFELESTPGKGTTVKARFWLESVPLCVEDDRSETPSLSG